MTVAAIWAKFVGVLRKQQLWKKSEKHYYNNTMPYTARNFDWCFMHLIIMICNITSYHYLGS
jgi:hypothetical protein